MTGNHLARVDDNTPEPVSSTMSELGYQLARLTPDQKHLLTDTIAKNATDDELELFLYQARAKGLDPFSGQIWFVKYDPNKAGTIMTGVHGLTLIAERTGTYAGIAGTWWCGPDGQWSEIWLKTDPPAAAKVTVRKLMVSGNMIDTTAVVMWDEYGKPGRAKDRSGRGTWHTLPATMIAKVARAHALREAFPAEMSGLYTREEMDQAEPVHAQVRELPSPPSPDALVSAEWVTKFAIGCREVDAAMCPDIDVDDFRHAVVYTATEGRVESSKQVRVSETGAIRSWLAAVKEGRAKVSGRVDGPPGLQLYAVDEAS